MQDCSSSANMNSAGPVGPKDSAFHKLQEDADAAGPGLRTLWVVKLRTSDHVSCTSFSPKIASVLNFG